MLQFFLGKADNPPAFLNKLDASRSSHFLAKAGSHVVKHGGGGGGGGRNAARKPDSIERQRR